MANSVKSTHIPLAFVSKGKGVRPGLQKNLRSDEARKAPVRNSSLKRETLVEAAKRLAAEGVDVTFDLSDLQNTSAYPSDLDVHSRRLALAVALDRYQEHLDAGEVELLSKAESLQLLKDAHTRLTELTKSGRAHIEEKRRA